jgi:hypothetical protein
LIESNDLDSILGDFGAIINYLEDTTDGEKKSELYRDWYSSDLPETVAGLFEQDRWLDGISALAGLGEYEEYQLNTPSELQSDSMRRYLRVTKSSYIAQAFGFDTMCWDSRRLHVLEPMIVRNIFDFPVVVPQTRGPYRTQGGSKCTDLQTITQERLRHSPAEYTVFARGIVDLLMDVVDVPSKTVLRHVLYNMPVETSNFHHELIRQF